MKERISTHLARVVDGKVEILYGEDYVVASDVLMLGQGEMNSEGIVLVGSSITRYMSNTQVDTAFLLAKTVELVSKAIDICGATYAVPMEAGVAQNPALQPIGSELNTLLNELQEHKLI